MHPSSLRHRGWPAVAAVLGALASPSGAQEPLSGSQSHVAALPRSLAGGGVAVSASFRAETALAGPPLGETAASASFSARGGAVFLDGVLAPGPPVVLGVLPAVGDAGGGEPVEIVGFGFQAPGSGGTALLFGDLSAGDVAVASNTVVQATTPVGKSALGNPLAGVDVGLTNQLGADERARAFRYLPALELSAPAVVSGTVELALTAQPDGFAVLALGTSVPGFGVPLEHIDGALELVLNIHVLGGLAPVSDGERAYAFPIPDDPTLAGAVLELQAAWLGSLSPLAGSFTNRLEVPVLP